MALGLHSALAIALAMTLSSCEDGPKTYDACMLQASKNAKTSHQFKVMSKSCKERFQARYQ